jgi:hypothetical protein
MTVYIRLRIYTVYYTVGVYRLENGPYIYGLWYTAAYGEMYAVYGLRVIFILYF